MNATIERKCSIDEVFASPFIELLGLAPRNPIVRGLILAQTGKMPGTEQETFDQIKEWVETTCEKKIRTQVRATEGFSVSVEFSETEYGRANYSVSQSGSDEFVFRGNELMNIVDLAIEDEDGLDRVVERLTEIIDDDAWSRCEPNMEDCGDYEYQEHNSNDSANTKVDYSTAQIRDRLVAFLRERYPEKLEALR